VDEDRSTVIRQLIKKAIAGEKIELAIKRFQEGVPFRKALEIAGLDYWDFQAELDKRGIPISTSLSFARRRIRQ
jgi:predicted HTH domain antitoxin